MNKKSTIIGVVTLVFIVIAVVVICGLLLKQKEATYTVTFSTNGGTTISQQVIKEGMEATMPQAPTKEGYTFVGWKLAGKEYNFNSKVNKDIVLEAVWEKIIPAENKVTIRFNTNGGAAVSEQAIEKGSKVVAPTNPVKEGYTFVEWQLDNKKFDFESEVDKDIELIAVWKEIIKEKYTVKFDSNGGSKVSSQTVIEGNKATKPTNPTKKGYDFAGWTLNGKSYDFSSKVNANITLVATWKEEAKKYTVKFNTDGGTTISNKTVTEGDKVVKPTNPTKKGYIFMGWTLNGTAYNFSSKVTENITLVATWREAKKYTVTFDVDGGTAVASQTITEGNKATKPTNPTKSGYTFTGWTLNGKAYDFTAIVNSNITLVATWKEIKKFSVTFDSNGGTSVASQTITEGNKVTKPTNPTRSGYVFTGWTLNGKTYDFSSKVTGNITLVANWKAEPKEYTVKFDSNGGSKVSSQTIKEGGVATKPSNPTKEGYNFSAWTLNGSTYSFSTKVTKDITLTAKWNAKTYRIKASKVDDYSPDRILSVYEDGKKITVKSIKYSNGTTLCSGTNTTVYYGDIEGISSYIVVLSGGTQMKATLN